MSNFHINPKTGRVSNCDAQQGGCPFTTFEHFETRREAALAYEESQKEYMTPPPVDKNDFNHSPLQRHLKKANYSVREQRGNKKTLILSDVDGTLVKGSLVLGHAVWLHDRGFTGMEAEVERWRSDEKNEEYINDLAIVYLKAITNRSIDDVKVKEYMDEVMSSKDNFYPVLEDLKQAREDGHEVILVSGSADYLIQDFAERHDFKGVGTAYHLDQDRKFNGRITGMFFTQAKQDYIRTLDIDAYDRVEAYGDTASDRPLIDAADYAVLVEPTSETSSRYENGVDMTYLRTSGNSDKFEELKTAFERVSATDD